MTTRSSTRGSITLSGTVRWKRSTAAVPSSNNSTEYAFACTTRGHWIKIQQPPSSKGISSGAGGAGTRPPCLQRHPGAGASLLLVAMCDGGGGKQDTCDRISGEVRSSMLAVASVWAWRLPAKPATSGLLYRR